MRLTDRFVTALERDYRMKETETEGHENIWPWRWVAQQNFTWNARVKITAEQMSEDGHNLTMLVSRPAALKRDFYVLLNDCEVDGEKVRAAFVKMVYRS